MWSAPKNEVTAGEKLREQLRILESAVLDLDDTDPRRPAVHKAIEYLSARCIRQGGVNLILAGMREGNPDYMTEGLKLLKRHLGLSS